MGVMEVVVVVLILGWYSFRGGNCGISGGSDGGGDGGWVEVWV